MIEMGRTLVGSHLGQILTCKPFRQSFCHKQRMSCWSADRKQSGCTAGHQTCGLVLHAQGSAQWEPQPKPWADHAAAWLRRLSMLCRPMHIPCADVPGQCWPPHECCLRHNAAKNSRMSALRMPDEHALHAQAFKGPRSLILSTAFNAATAEGGNPLWPGIGYEGADPERSQKPSQARMRAEAVLQQAVLHVGDTHCKDPQDFLKFIRSGIGKAFCSKASN